jgi:hypothetical protein
VSLQSDFDEFRRAKQSLHEALNQAPFVTRFVLALTYQWWYWIGRLNGDHQPMPVWFERTLLQTGDGLLKAGRYMKRVMRIGVGR